MLASSAIRSLITPGSDNVAFTWEGELVDLPEAAHGPASLLVMPVSDALKTVSGKGFVEGSVDRDDVWSAVAFVLSTEVARRLEGEFASPFDLYEAVIELGDDWLITPMPSAL